MRSLFSHPAAGPPPGTLVRYVLDDGTILIRRSDYEAGIYPIGRRFVPALP